MKIALFLDNIYVYYRKIEGLKDKINKGACPESPSYHKNPLWERLPAAK
jgi:hypothetical protein